MIADDVAAAIDSSGETFETLVALEQAALTRWGNGDPSGFQDLCADEVSYFDPFLVRRLDGLAAVTAYYETIRGQVSIDRFELLAPAVREAGDLAVLSFDYVSSSGDRESRWHCTEVFARRAGRWRIVHTHWSQPRV